MMHTRDSLTADLGKLGVAPGDVILVHSSWKSIGAVAGGVDSLIAALLQSVGDNGTVMMPGFQGGSEYRLAEAGCVFDVRATPSECGYLTEAFRHHPEAARSLSPTHSVTAAGARRDEMIAGHLDCSVTTGWESPFHRLVAADGKILLLGVDHRVNTTLHFLENTAGAPTLCAWKFPVTVIDAAGVPRVVEIHPHLPGLARCYQRAEAFLQQAGLLHTGRVGDAAAQCFSAAGLDRILRPLLRQSPTLLIDIFTPGRCLDA